MPDPSGFAGRADAIAEMSGMKECRAIQTLAPLFFMAVIAQRLGLFTIGAAVGLVG